MVSYSRVTEIVVLWATLTSAKLMSALHWYQPASAAVMFLRVNVEVICEEVTLLDQFMQYLVKLLLIEYSEVLARN